MRKKYQGGIIANVDSTNTHRIMIGVPLTGLVRAEWAMARYNQATPTNWSVNDMVAWLDQTSPLRFTVPNARNLIVQKAIEGEYEWLFFLDHDVILPPLSLIKLNTHMRSGKYPILNGLYFTKSKPAEPLIYRGAGTGCCDDWKLGEIVWADGAGMGCTLIHRSILKAIWSESAEYTINNMTARQVFRNPLEHKYDEKTGSWGMLTGTEDLDFYKRLTSLGIYKKAGWPEFQKML